MLKSYRMIILLNNWSEVKFEYTNNEDLIEAIRRLVDVISREELIFTCWSEKMNRRIYYIPTKNIVSFYTYKSID